MFLDDPVDNGQTEACALFLGGDIRFEQVIEYRWGKSRPVIVHMQLDKPLPVGFVIARADAQRRIRSGTQGIAGIEQQIVQHLAQPAGIRVHRRQPTTSVTS